MLRHGDVRTTLKIYSHAVDANKWRRRDTGSNAQWRNGCGRGNGAGREEGAYLLRKDGRHEETRTPDLYRVKVAL
jgi:hypothetical protein